MSNDAQLVLPKVDTGSLALWERMPVLPAAPTTTALQSLSATTETRKTLSCKALLVGDTLARAEAEARKMLPEMFASPQVRMAYGLPDLDGANGLIDEVLSHGEPVDTQQIEELMKRLSREMRKFGKTYDPANPEVLEKYQKVKGKILGIWRGGKTFLEEFLDDVRDLQGKFDHVIDTCEDQEYELLRNVSFYDNYYGRLEEETDKLTYTIAVMEIIRDLAAAQADAIEVGDASLGDRGDERKQALADFVSLMENKIAAFKGRLWAAWAMAPQIRLMRTGVEGLADKVNQTIHIGIPTLKSTVVVWMKLGKAVQIAQVNRAIDDVINDAMVQFAQAAAISVPVIVAQSQTPSLRPQTVVAMANLMAQEADAVVAALQAARDQRAELDAAMLAGKDVLDAANQRIDNAKLQHVLEMAHSAELQIAKSVPAQN